MSDFERIFSIERHPSIEKKYEDFVWKKVLDEVEHIPKTVDIPILENKIAKGKKKDSGRAIKKGSKR